MPGFGPGRWQGLAVRSEARELLQTPHEPRRGARCGGALRGSGRGSVNRREVSALAAERDEYQDRYTELLRQHQELQALRQWTIH